MKSKLIRKFMKLNNIEKKQLQQNKFVSDFANRSTLNQNKQYTIPVFTPEFFNNQDIFISKHNRFADYPKHTHTFLEMNYMLSGQAHELVGNDQVTLHQGDILILDVGTTHSIKALSQKDILINIIFRKQINFSFDNLRTMAQKNDIQTKFLLSNDQLSRYLIYRAAKTENNVQIMANQIIEEYFNPGAFSKQLMNSYLNAFLILLSRNTSLHSSTLIKKEVPPLVLYILKEISQNFQNLSLNKLAQQSNYNRSYLGAILKKETGISFSQALTEQRLLAAYNLLNSTTLPVSEIIAEVGISNKTYFYKKFKEKFKKTPNQVRV